MARDRPDAPSTDSDDLFLGCDLLEHLDAFFLDLFADRDLLRRPDVLSTELCVERDLVRRPGVPLPDLFADRDLLRRPDVLSSDGDFCLSTAAGGRGGTGYLDFARFLPARDIVARDFLHSTFQKSPYSK